MHNHPISSPTRSAGVGKSRWLRRLLIGAFAAGYSAISLAAAVDVAQIPLYLGGGVKPNIMFILDDSGSMQWEQMPDGIILGGAYYMFPRASSVYGGSDYGNNVPTVDVNVYGARTRSSDINKMYYDPNITYLPWLKSDGSSYPNAVPTAAYHNAENTAAGTRDLTVDNTQSARWISCTNASTCSSVTATKTFYPATYFTYNGAGDWTLGNFTRVEIKPASAGGADTYARTTARTDCAAAPVCTYAEEIQNFANWYTYYRSRILTARAGVGRAFAQLPEPVSAAQAPRVGFASINTGTNTVDGVSTPVVISGVRPFIGADRQAFFTDFYQHVMPAAGTPLRRALDTVGQYYKRTDDKGPWSDTPGTAGGSNLSCRQSFDILMTDGYWNGSNPSFATGNQDGTDGTTITGPNGKSYTYTATSPFMDSWSNTLADVAMYYWKNDLQSGLTNDVPTNPSDPAFWQHMVTFGVGLGVQGSINPDDAFAAIGTGATITWPQPSTSGTTENLDDLLHSAVNSRGKYYSAKDPQTFAQGLADSLNVIIGRTSSAAAIATNSTRLDANTYIFQAKYDSSDWSGHVLAYPINPLDGSVGSAAWDAATEIPAAATRKIYSYDGTQGIDFKWPSLTAAQQTALTSVDIVNYLRGDQSKEIKNGGTYRNRIFLLGDIVNSDPWFVGADNYGYNILPDPEGNLYPDFIDGSTVKGRPPMLYFSANDGMLHGVDATTGIEKLAFVPNNIIANLKNLADKAYTHQYFVDGSPKAGDAYITISGTKKWRTVLAAATGAGGKSVFALDVTDPTNFTASNVLWEYTDTELGTTIGQPSVVRLADGHWGAIFGNGYNSTSQKAQLYIVNLETGALITRIDTGVGSSAAPNGLATPIVIDENGDRIADYVYAGDLQGNLWKFDISNKLVSKWDIPFSKAGKPAPLFTAIGPDGLAQPITAKPQVKRHPTSGLIVYFGTGKYFETGDNVIPATPPVQTFYGIFDQGVTVARSELLQQQIAVETSQTFTNPTTGSSYNYDIRVMTDNPIQTEKGFYIDLISPVNGKEGERIVSEPVAMSDRVLFTTLIPDPNPCSYGGTGWLMEVDPTSGGRLNFSAFDLNHDGQFNNGEYVTVVINGKSVIVPVSGKKSKEGIIKTPGIVCTGEKCLKYQSGSTGNIEVTANKGTGGLGRQSWQQIK